MKPAYRCAAIRGLVALIALSAGRPAAAIMGIPDKVPGASLIVPYFEVGIDPGLHPNDTLLTAVNHQTAGDHILHVHVWDIDGQPVLSDNVTVGPLATYSQSMRALIDALGTVPKKLALTQGEFYRGFVTIDSVTASTGLDPRQPAFPFESSNVLTGKIYYTRLSEGSAAGLSMIALEAGSPPSTYQHGFYRAGDNREEIDLDARVCVDQLARGVACTGDADGLISRLFFRVFGSAGALSGSTDMVVFAWYPAASGGPSAYCAAHACATDYDYRRRDETGATVASSTTKLTHVVNLITTASPAVSGHAVIFNVPSIQRDLQFFHFSINRANPAGHPELTFDAVFEGDYLP